MKMMTFELAILSVLFGISTFGMVTSNHLVSTLSNIVSKCNCYYVHVETCTNILTKTAKIEKNMFIENKVT